MHITSIYTKSIQLLGLLYRMFYSSVNPAFLCKSVVPIRKLCSKNPCTFLEHWSLHTVWHFSNSISCSKMRIFTHNNFSHNHNWLPLFSFQYVCSLHVVVVKLIRHETKPSVLLGIETTIFLEYIGVHSTFWFTVAYYGAQKMVECVETD